jgi:hypothetical protein
MYWTEHSPPHFHVAYNEYAAEILIETGEIIKGKMPPKATSIIKEWTNLHRKELMKNWELAQKNKELMPIEPLE